MALLVYDEIHYLKDKERGVVWEETIMMAPRAARFAFLSATIPNAREFAEWVAQVHGTPCHVVYTDYRPTPLQHYMFPQGEQSCWAVWWCRHCSSSTAVPASDPQLGHSQHSTCTLSAMYMATVSKVHVPHLCIA